MGEKITACSATGTSLPWFGIVSAGIINKTRYFLALTLQPSLNWYFQWRIQVRPHFDVSTWSSWGLAWVKITKERGDTRLGAFLLFGEPAAQELARGLKISLLLFLCGSMSLARAEAQWQELDCQPCRIRTSGKERFSPYTFKFQGSYASPMKLSPLVGDQYVTT